MFVSFLEENSTSFGKIEGESLNDWEKLEYIDEESLQVTEVYKKSIDEKFSFSFENAKEEKKIFGNSSKAERYWIKIQFVDEKVSSSRAAPPKTHRPAISKKTKNIKANPVQQSQNEKSCTLCKINLQTSKSLKKHLDSKSHLRRHKKLIDEMNIITVVKNPCDKEKITEIPIPRNKFYRASGEFHCKECDRLFTRKCYYTQHMNYAHSDVSKKFICYCGKKFETEQQLYDHSQKHNGTKAHKCPFCSASYNTKTDLKRHHIAHHEPSLLFRCEDCGNGFARHDHLQAHYKSHKTEGRTGMVPNPLKRFKRSFSDLEE